MAERIPAGSVQVPAVGDVVGQAKALFDWALHLCLWIAVTSITVIFIASVAKEWGLSQRYVPTVDFLKLCYAAGVVWLLRNTKV